MREERSLVGSPAHTVAGVQYTVRNAFSYPFRIVVPLRLITANLASCGTILKSVFDIDPSIFDQG